MNIAEAKPRLTPEQALAVDTSDSRIVTAGAGSGKTTVLTRRYLLYLASGIRPEEIVAITFTKKAAREMRERIQRALSQEVAGASGTALEYWKGLRDELPAAQITTIHGFYAALLRDYPLETGIDPGFAVLDEADAAFLRRQAAIKLMGSLDKHPAQELLIRVMGAEALEEEGGLAAKLVQVYTALVNQGLDPLEVACAPAQEDWRQCRLDFLSLVAGEGDIISKLKGRDDLTLLRSQFTRLAPMLQDTADAQGLLAILPALKEAANLGPGVAPNLHKDFMKQGAALCRRLLSVAISPLIGEAFRELLCMYSQTYSNLKQEAKGLDFNDLQFRVKQLLSDHSQVRREIQSRFRRFMIDEFQDTDSLQKEIIWLLVGQGGDVGDSLFIVGDEKQSIYRFRGADVGIFGRVRQDLTGVNPQRAVVITANFRSRPGLINLVNQFFAQLMVEEESEDIPYHPLKPVRSGPQYSAEFIPLAKEGPSQEAVISQRLRKMVEAQELMIGDDQPRPVAWGDIAILIRSRTRLADLERHLRLAGIPYVVVGGIGFFRRPEILDLVNLLRVLAYGLDKIALTAVLRSPLFGISDAALICLAGAGGGNIEGLTQEEQAIYHKAIKTLEDLKGLEGTLLLPELLELALAKTGFREVVLTGFGGLQALANIEKLLDMARTFHRKGFQSTGDFLSYLELVGQGNGEGEAVVDSEGENVVRIMTIHASKGLEFPVVVIPGAQSRSKSSAPQALLDGSGSLVTKQAWDCPSYEICRKLYASQEAKEAKRLLYVAMTRAQDYLVVTAQEPGPKEENTFNKWLWDFASRSNPLLPHREVTQAIPPIPSQGRPLPEPGPTVPPPQEPGLEPVGSQGRTFHYFSISQFLLWKRDPHEFRRVYLSRWLDFDPQLPRDSGSQSHEPGGADFGSLLHRVLELSPKNPQALVAQLIPQYFPHLDRQGKEQVASTAQELLTAYLNQPAPISQVLEIKNELVFFQRIGPGVFTGVIDQVLVGKDRVAVVDFKTNRLVPGGQVELAAYYRPQLLFYAGAAEQLYKKPAEAWLQLLRLPPGEQLVKIEFSPQDIANLQQELAEFVTWCHG
jgi:ATP-dependent helicase/nuclease subunit A